MGFMASGVPKVSLRKSSSLTFNVFNSCWILAETRPLPLITEKEVTTIVKVKKCHKVVYVEAE